MTDLLALLAGPPAVRRWHATFAADDIRLEAARAGWHVGAVDGWTLTGRDQLLQAIGEALDFPEHYGRNLDALADCLAELSQPTLLLWDGWAVLYEEDLAGFLGVLAVLTDLSGSSGGERPCFSVLLRGDGPELPGVDDLA